MSRVSIYYHMTLSPPGSLRCKVMVDKEAQESSVYVSFKTTRSGLTSPAEYLEYMKVRQRLRKGRVQGGGPRSGVLTLGSTWISGRRGSCQGGKCPSPSGPGLWELTRTALSFRLFNLPPHHPPLQDRVFETALSSRLFKLSRETDPPFASAALGQEPLTATIQTHTLTATPMEGGSLWGVGGG